MQNFLAFPDDARIWIYSSDRRIPVKQVENLQSDIASFAKHWQSHQIDLVATGGLFHQYFIVFVVDESKNPPGGCSIDKSVHFLQQLEKKYDIGLFNRTIVYYLKDDTINTLSLNELSEAYHEKVIDINTLFFDPLVKTKSEFLSGWLKPLEKSWHKKFINIPVNK